MVSRWANPQYGQVSTDSNTTSFISVSLVQCRRVSRVGGRAPQTFRPDPVGVVSDRCQFPVKINVDRAHARLTIIVGVGERALLRALACHVDLELRDDPRALLVAQADADRRQVAGTVVLAEIVKILDRGRLELAVDERVEILADRLVLVRADDHVRAAGAGL